MLFVYLPTHPRQSMEIYCRDTTNMFERKILLPNYLEVLAAQSHIITLIYKRSEKLSPHLWLEGNVYRQFY